MTHNSFMTAPQPLARIEQIERELSELVVLLPRFLERSDPRVIQWEDEIERSLQGKGNRAKAFEVRAFLAHMTGDIEFVERCMERAEINGASELALAALRTTIYSNLGFSTKAQEAGRRAFEVARLNLAIGVLWMTSAGALNFAAKLLDQAALAKIDCSHITHYDAILKVASYTKMNVFSDAEFGKILDMAGELMREKKLFWLDLAPRISFDAEMNCAGIRYRLDVSPEEASELNSQLTEKIVEADLVLVPLTVRFIGVQLEPTRVGF